MAEKLYIIDTTSPFFYGHPRTVVNWSKVPYDHIEKDGEVTGKVHKKIRSRFEKYIVQVSFMGFNAVSIDEVCRLVPFPFYPPKLNKKIAQYRKYYQRLFEVCGEYGMKIFLTTDIMFMNASIQKETGGKYRKWIAVLSEALTSLFHDFSEVDGVIFRIGESDGLDVKGDFQSRLVVKTPVQARKLIAAVLPIFEKYNRKLIFRTWTFGAYQIGDLIWNPKTYQKVFRGIRSKNFIISMKYGESDFFRYLELNELFFKDNQQKIIELQTRREYEGFGEFPSFVGWDYYRFYQKLKTAENMAGIHVWCQTGGWSRLRNFTFTKKTSFWNELNTFAAIRIYRYGDDVRQVVRQFCGKKGLMNTMKFLKLSDQVIHNILYDPQFSKQKLYFNRIRIPPVFHVFWDHITVTDIVAQLYLSRSHDGHRLIREGWKTLEKIKLMGKINRTIGLPYDCDFQYDTFRVFAVCRELIYSDNPEKAGGKTDKFIREYHARYPDAYRIYINRDYKENFLVSFFLRIAIRKKRGYRILDRLLFNPLSAWIIRFFIRRFKKQMPSFLGKQGMPVERMLF